MDTIWLVRVLRSAIFRDVDSGVVVVTAHPVQHPPHAPGDDFEPRSYCSTRRKIVVDWLENNKDQEGRRRIFSGISLRLRKH